jgi:polyisoprenyl-phosphate glycosyltransferase
MIDKIMTTDHPTSPTYSIVVPVFNEAQTLGALHQRLTKLMDDLDGACELVLVNDGSDDESSRIMAELASTDPRVKMVDLSRNFGHQIAVTAGLDYASGDAAIIMDADLQDPPEVALEMAAKWREGYEVVYAVREHRAGESWFKRASAAIFYRGLRKLTETDIPVDTGDFRLVDRKVLDTVRRMPESHRFLRGMFAWVGFRQTGVSFRRDDRFAGETKYPLRKMIKLAADGVLGFSNEPLRLGVKLGFVVAGGAVLYGIAMALLKVFGIWAASGWTSLIVVITFLGGVQLMVIGTIGEYLGRVYDEVRGRPLYVVRETHGFGDPPPDATETE